jgi:Tol biopolymer transport system component
VRWTVSGRETDTVFDLRSKDGSLRVTLATQAGRWVVTAIGPVPAQGKILYTGTRPVVRGLFVTDTAAAAPPRTLGDGARYAWSPDYARVAYDWQGLVYVVDSDGGNPKLVGPGTAPAWSPDGQRLAIERGSNTGPQIVVVTLTDGSERVLVAGSRPTWAPKQAGVGERIAYSFTGSAAAPPALYVVDVAGGAVSVLASDGAEPIWSPDGGAVAFLTSRQEIAVVTLNPAVVRTVGSGGGYTWSSDGKRLAFLSATPAGAPIVWDRERTETRKLLERSDVDGLSWSPDGTEIVLSLASGNGLWLAASDGSNLRKLGDGRDPMWASSPRAGR